MREAATLRLDSGDEVRVEVDRADLDRDEILVRRASATEPSEQVALLTAIDAHLATATPHAAGTTDRLLEDDRERPY